MKKRHSSRHWIGIALLVGSIMGWTVPVQAHKVTIFAWIEGNTIHTQSKFSGGRPVKQGRIEVLDTHGTKLLEGTTDDQGLFAFAVPQKTDLKVVLTAGTGHGNHWVIKADEIEGMEPMGENIGTTQTPSVSRRQPKPGDEPNRSPTAEACLDAHEVEHIVNQALEKKLAPLTARLAEQRWQWREIIAGIGYILGLVGLASYVHYRKRGR